MTEILFSQTIRDATLALINKSGLSEDRVKEIFDIILESSHPTQTAGFLMALATHGEEIAHLKGARRSLLAHMRQAELEDRYLKNAIDIVGTGGDGLNTLNISTAASILVSSLEIPVAKHGNRAVSSRSGASDVLSEIGYKFPEPDEVTNSIAQSKFAFLFAPKFHPSMKNVAPVRAELKLPSIFNILGPLCNPARVKFMVIGVADQTKIEIMAHTIKDDVERALVIHNSSGADEILAFGTNFGLLIENGTVSDFSLSPEDAGFRSYDSIEEIKGKDIPYNASRIINLLNNTEPMSIFHDSVVMTASVALFIAGKVSSVKEGSLIASNAIANGKAAKTLLKLQNQ